MARTKAAQPAASPVSSPSPAPTAPAVSESRSAGPSWLTLLAPLLLALLAAFILRLIHLILEPIYNSIPLSLHTLPLYLAFFPAPFLAARGTRTEAYLALAGAGTMLAAAYGREVGSFLADAWGPRWGALGARFVLGWGAMSGLGATAGIVDGRGLSDESRTATRRGASTAVWLGTVWLGGYLTTRLRLAWMQHPEGLLSNTALTLLVVAFIVMYIQAEDETRSPWTAHGWSWAAASIVIFAAFALHHSHHPLTPLEFPHTFPLGTTPLDRLPNRYGLVVVVLWVTAYYASHRANGQLTNRHWALFAIAGVALSVLPLKIPAPHAPEATLRVISSERGVTGQVVVADDLERGLRYLRCDASILGGRWFHEGELSDSIFATFPLQEIGMFATTPRDAPRALIIGLGVGIAANAFTRAGYVVDIVEIDALVYRAARDHFGLLPSGHVHIGDGAEYVQTVKSGPQYDLVVQDCFTGGSVPGEMFTLEFWRDLKLRVKRDGVVAMNFVGLRHTKASRAVLVTLLSSFEQCRAFEESINMIVLCSAQAEPLLSFRRATRQEIGTSGLREHVYTTYHASEVRLDEIVNGTDFVTPELQLKRGKQKLNQWQTETALSTWVMIRQILKPEMWLAW